MAPEFLKSYSTNDLTYPDQYDPSSGFFSNDIYTNDPTAGDNLSYMDINTGIYWSKEFIGFKPFIGLSLFHINSPKESFLNDNNRLPSRKVIHAGSTIYLNEKIFIVPNILYMSNDKANDLLAGTNVGYVFLNEFNIKKAVFLGSYFRDGISRNPDAIVIVGGVNYNKFDVGISYDINISDLNKVTNNKGGFEISLIYKGIDYQLKQISIPCDVH